MKMLLVCPHFRNIEYGIVQSFTRLGVDVHPFFFHVGFSKRHWMQRLKNKLGISIEDFLLKEKVKFNHNLLEEYDRIRPDWVYVIQGRWMDTETIKYMSKNSYTSLYLWDMLSLFPEMEEGFQYYSAIYSFDQKDTETLLNRGLNSRFKPSGYDNSVYYPLQVEKKYDVAFIGAMYPERKVLLKKLIEHFPDIRWVIYGEYAPIRKPVDWIKWRFSVMHNYFKNKNIDKKKVNEVYNEACIVLSIVRENQSDGWSSRLTEILGARAFQITNYFPAVETEFTGSLVTYRDFTELVRLIDFYLKHEDDRKKIAEHGYNKVIIEYSDDSINSTLIDDYYKWIDSKC